MSKELTDVAKIVMSQIMGIDPSAVMVWGARDYITLDSNDKQEGGMAFIVSGLKLKGQVEIRLQWDDTYTIRFLKDGVEIKKSETVYCD